MKTDVSTEVKAPLEVVWQAWTTPDDINQWNAASDDWHNPRSQIDLRVTLKIKPPFRLFAQATE